MACAARTRRLRQRGGARHAGGGTVLGDDGVHARLHRADPLHDAPQRVVLRRVGGPRRARRRAARRAPLMIVAARGGGGGGACTRSARRAAGLCSPDAIAHDGESGSDTPPPAPLRCAGRGGGRSPHSLHHPPPAGLPAASTRTDPGAGWRRGGSTAAGRGAGVATRRWIAGAGGWGEAQSGCRGADAAP
eukprot:gene17907-21697_t